MFCHILEEGGSCRTPLSRFVSSLPCSARDDLIWSQISTHPWTARNTKVQQRLWQNVAKSKLSMSSSSRKQNDPMSPPRVTSAPGSRVTAVSRGISLIMVHEEIIDRAMPIVAKQRCVCLKGVAITHGPVSAGTRQVGTLRPRHCAWSNKGSRHSRFGCLEARRHWRVRAAAIQRNSGGTIEPSLRHGAGQAPRGCVAKEGWIVVVCCC